MSHAKHEYLIAVRVLLAGVAGAATILTVPPLFDPQSGAPVWITVALGCVFLALVASAVRLRREHVPRRR